MPKIFKCSRTADFSRPFSENTATASINTITGNIAIAEDFVNCASAAETPEINK